MEKVIPRSREAGTAVDAFPPLRNLTTRWRRPVDGVPTGRVIAFIPAHNEEASIGDTIRSLGRQTLRPAQIVVICDNCTDDTAGVAAAAGARVLTTVGNKARKAGALNQALDRLLPALSDDNLVLVMDADSRISRNWVADATGILRDGRVGAVCGVFLGESGGGLIGQLQRNEYFRYARSVHRQGQAPVLSGTGTLFRVSALRRLAHERGHSVPGLGGDYYDSQALTEDNEITLALKTLGYRCVAGPGCETVTEVMPTWRTLFSQRLRWQRGTLSDLRRYGLTRVTWPYWIKQFAMYAAFFLSIACWIIMVFELAHHAGINVPWSIAVAGLNFVERLWTVRKAGPRGIFLSALMIPEVCYELFRMIVFFRALTDEVARRGTSWDHLNKGARQ